MFDLNVLFVWNSDNSIWHFSALKYTVYIALDIRHSLTHTCRKMVVSMGENNSLKQVAPQLYLRVQMLIHKLQLLLVYILLRGIMSFCKSI